jgi:hypothetical protein
MVRAHKPPNEHVIDEVWVGLSEDPDGKNGICAWVAPGIGRTSMLTASKKVLEYFKQTAVTVAVATDARVKIYRFTRAECVYDSENLG